MKNKWYVANTCTHNGLVVEEKSGENIAVTYKKENARLIASAPELLKALMDIIKNIENDNLEEFLIEAKDVIKKARRG